MPEPARSAPPREVLIVMLSALGDAVHVLPVLNALKRAWPDTRITWVIQPVPHQLVANHEAVDEFIIFQRRRGLAALDSYRQLRRAFAGRHFDLLINLQVYFKAGLITALAPARIKLGFDRRRARDLNWLFTNQRIAPHPADHVQDQYFEFAEHLGIAPEPVEWKLHLTDQERRQQAGFFAPLGRTCALVVATSKPQKNWAPERYAQVIDALETRFGLRCILVGGPAPIEQAAAARVTGLCRSQPINALGNDVRRALWLLEGSSLVISPDTGPLHIARAVDTPVIGLYGYTNPKRYGPYRKYHDLVVDGYAEYPGEDYPLNTEYREEGMQRVTVEAVLEKAELALERYVRKQPRGWA
ncbi:MAG TPA: glycosyltransferase family 9 protein [Longimicrobiales bacterium]